MYTDIKRQASRAPSNQFCRCNLFSCYLALFSSFSVFFPFLPSSKNMLHTNSIGKTTAASIPFFKSSDAALEIQPTRAGPVEHPRSPASASNANSAVPPFRSIADALLKVPGHIIPTDKPQTAQPARDKAGDDEREIHRYAVTQRIPLPVIK